MTAVTAITVVKDDPEGLRKTWLSVLEQRGRAEVQWVIIDGGGCSEIDRFLEALDAPWVTWESGPDSGIYDAMNKATKYLTTDYCIYLNAGDTFASPTSIHDALADAESRIPPRPESRSSARPPIVFGGYLLVNSNGAHAKSPRHPWFIRHSLPTSHQAIMFPCEFIRAYGYNTGLRICGDFELVSRAHADHWPFMRASVPIAVFRSGGTSTRNKALLLEEAAMVQRSVLGLPAFFVAASKLLRRLGMRELT